MSGFAITGGAGFHITFDNGVTVSVQFGGCTYSQHHNECAEYKGDGNGLRSVDAETAVFDKDGHWLTKTYRPTADDDVFGWQSPEQVLDLLNWASKYKAD